MGRGYSYVIIKPPPISFTLYRTQEILYGRIADPRATPHMKGVGMLVVPLRGANFGFWSHLGCSGQNAIVFSREGLVEGCTRKNLICISLMRFNIYSIHIIRVFSFVCVLTWSLLGVKKSLSTPRSVSFRALIQNFRRAYPPLSHAESPPPRDHWVLKSRWCQCLRG